MLMRQLSSVVCPALFNIFSYTALCRKKLLNIKCVFLLFYLQLVSETFLILRRNERDIMKSILVFMQSNHSSCQILMKLLFSWQIFEKYSYTNRHKNPSSERLGSLDISYGRTDVQTDEWICMTKLRVFFAILRSTYKQRQKSQSWVLTRHPTVIIIIIIISVRHIKKPICDSKIAWIQLQQLSARGPEISFALLHGHRCTAGSTWWIYCLYNTWNLASPFMHFTRPASRYESCKRVRPLRLSQTELRCLWSVFGKGRFKTTVSFQSRKPVWELIKTVNHHHPIIIPYFSHPPTSLSSSPF